MQKQRDPRILSEFALDTQVPAVYYDQFVSNQHTKTSVVLSVARSPLSATKGQRLDRHRTNGSRCGWFPLPQQPHGPARACVPEISPPDWSWEEQFLEHRHPEIRRVASVPLYVRNLSHEIVICTSPIVMIEDGDELLPIVQLLFKGPPLDDFIFHFTRITENAGCPL